MEFTVEKKELSKCLTNCVKFAERKGTMPILLNVKISVSQEMVSLFATDLEIGIIERLWSAKITSEGETTLPAKKLKDALGKMGKEDGEISFLLKENGWVEIRNGKLKVNMMGISAETFPSFPTLKESRFRPLDARMLAEMINKTSFAISTDESRYNLNGIHFCYDFKKDVVKAISTDGYRLALVDAPMRIKGMTKEGMILPREGVSLLAKIMKEGQILALKEGNHFVVRQNGTVIFMRTLDAQFPDYKQVIPSDVKYCIQVKTDELKEVVKRVYEFSSERTKGIKFSFSLDTLKLSTYNPDYGEAEEEMTVQGDTGETQVGFNGRFVLDILDSIESESVLIGFNDGTSPVCFVPTDGDNEQAAILMPMRI